MDHNRKDSMCPFCAKTFPTQHRMLQHLNHPLSRCAAAWYAKNHARLSDIAESGFYRQAHNVAPPRSHNAYPPDVSEDNHPMDLDPPITHMEGSAVEEFPGAGETYGRGKTFMQTFDEDEHNAERTTNIYFPFSSGDEWQLASFLMRSGMTTTLVNEFLKLNLVRVFMLT